ncbi:hypothetical protein M406DRAFT_351932 [Cryphonectria parasitica EP155]|uniref:HMG box domain-containing protein n=1 Tax=Cryphonectria parasitica (strain ATCC 38755 / EP155) TaxID=660469 RepID=A0A9P5CMX7_CRYP1|nr:uncharacterized protein M406DRAFT_351932 [Cryphonectria parasitica EP155]KAF3764854.1 hypothetical protein M406DRAFT_351932 [Cryphonectria parasitica EP155]
MAHATHLSPSEISYEKMDPAAGLPLSPTTSSNDGQLPQGFDELVHHNNNNNTNNTNNAISYHTSSSHNLQYGLPSQQQQQQQQQQQRQVYGREYTYQSQPTYDSHDGVYPSPDEPPYTTPASSPSQRSDILSLRQGHIQRPATVPRPLAAKTRVQKAKRKKGRERSDKDKVHLEKPLSEMGEEWKRSMLEIEAYINRSAEARRQEIETDRKQPGKIKRPMNSFMLYRKAFQNHTKAYCEHNNHQVVSKVCGASWDQEPDHIRKQFADWAKLERTNHQKAHPGYKFTPAKPKNQKRKHDSDDEASDLEMYDWEGGPRGVKRDRSQTGTPIPEPELYGHHQAYYQPGSHYPPQHQQIMHPRAVLSSYSYSNPNKQMPAPYGSMALGQSGQYLSPNSMANSHYHQRGYAVEDVSYHKTPSPGNTYHQPMQPDMMDPYVTSSRHHPLEHTPQPAHFMQNDHVDTGLYPVGNNSFDPSNPLHLPDHAIENTGLDFSFNDSNLQQAGSNALSNAFGDESLLQDQQAQQLLRGNDECWDIQPLDESQVGDQYDDWGVDPSLSQPYPVNDPPLSETYTARD